MKRLMAMMFALAPGVVADARPTSPEVAAESLRGLACVRVPQEFV
jgi:hypothetical protein